MVTLQHYLLVGGGGVVAAGAGAAGFGVTVPVMCNLIGLCCALEVMITSLLIIPWRPLVVYATCITALCFGKMGS